MLLSFAGDFVEDLSAYKLLPIFGPKALLGEVSKLPFALLRNDGRSEPSGRLVPGKYFDQSLSGDHQGTAAACLLHDEPDPLTDSPVYLFVITAIGLCKCA
jgi:hypothetical protein